MGKQFNLSEKIENTESVGWTELPPFIPIEYVKEFIRLLKEKFKERKWVWNEEKFGTNAHKKFNEFNKELIAEIDKLVGDKLNGVL